jgi:hypothetical protein
MAQSACRSAPLGLVFLQASHHEVIKVVHKNIFFFLKQPAFTSIPNEKGSKHKKMENKLTQCQYCQCIPKQLPHRKVFRTSPVPLTYSSGLQKRRPEG